MSSRTSSLSTLTTVPSTMSPSLKYLMVSSIAARKASSEPMSLTATLGVEVASVLLVMCRWTPDTDRDECAGSTAWRVRQQKAMDFLPGQHDRPRLAVRLPRGLPDHWRTTPEHSAATSI